MTNILTSTLEEQLAKNNLSLNNWRELIQRLLDYGVLCRDDSQVEAELYDRFVRIHELVNDFLAMIGLRFHHDSHFRLVRILPPGARMPGVEDEGDEPLNAGLRNRLNQHEIALILVLRAEYDKALREGNIDEQGSTTLSMEAIALAMKSLLRRNLPENSGERRQAFKRLRQLRLVHYVADVDMEAGDAWIKIRPHIVQLVSNEWLAQIREHLADAGLLITQEDPIASQAAPVSIKASPQNSRSLFAND